MKNTNEIVTRIKARYTIELRNRDGNLRLSQLEEECNHHKKSQMYENYANENQARMNELADMYSFITSKVWTDCVKELHDYAKGIRG